MKTFLSRKNEENERGGGEYGFGRWKAGRPVVLTLQTWEMELFPWQLGKRRLSPSYTGISSKVLKSGSAKYLRKHDRAQVKKVVWKPQKQWRLPASQPWPPTAPPLAHPPAEYPSSFTQKSAGIFSGKAKKRKKVSGMDYQVQLSQRNFKGKFIWKTETQPALTAAPTPTLPQASPLPHSLS